MKSVQRGTPALLAAAAGSLLAASASGDVTPNAGMIRMPDVSGSHIVFVYANDIWMVPRAGGTATPLASPPGRESFPRFNADGTTLAFIGNYEGDRDIYTVNTSGGDAFRVTHHPGNEVLCDWTPDGELLYYMSGMAGLGRQQNLFTVSAEGGMPDMLPPAYASIGAISPDGTTLAFTPYSRDSRTWKRYMGGMASDIWLMNLDDKSSQQITEWKGTDSQPMWHGDTMYFLSDAGPAHRLNIWSYDDGKLAQVTSYTDYDVKWPSVGPGATGAGEIVFQNGKDVVLLDLATGQASAVEISIPGERQQIRTRVVDAGKNLGWWDISSSGKRIVTAARGDVWTLPAKNGTPRNLTRSSGAGERFPVWSPDGKLICYSSDADGEYELYLAPSNGKGEVRQLTDGNKTFFFDVTWSPDSETVVYMDKAGNMYRTDIESAKTEIFDREEWAYQVPFSFSHDSTWLTYHKNADNSLSSIWLYNLETGDKHQVTGEMFDDSNPTFDREGDYLYYVSAHDFSSPIYEDVGSTFVYAGISRLMVVPLRDEVGSPFAAEVDEETWDDEDEADSDEDGDDTDDAEENGDDDADEDAAADDENGDADEDGDEDKDGDDNEDGDDEEDEPLEIELVGFEARGIQLPVDRGNFGTLSVNDSNKLIYVRRTPRGVKGEAGIKIFDVNADEDDRKEETVMDGTGNYELSADGKKIAINKKGKFAIADAKKDAKMDDAVSTKGLEVTIEPREEWRQVFTDAWRRHRDFFYVENMHGVDWDAVYTRYSGMLDDAVSRDDVSFIIGEMIAELNVGHAYYWGGDVESQPTRNVGMLGADYELEDGAFRITKILEGAAWDADGRGPLSQPGVDVSVGDYILAVDGIEIDTTKDIWAAFIGLSGKPVTLTFNDVPEINDDAREIVIKPMGGEGSLRYRAWVESNRAHVAESTSGRVGYVHVPDTGVNGQNELFRQFYGQINTDGMIIDERWNGGGQLPNRFIELLDRPRTNYFARRDGKDWPVPGVSHQGPKAMLINGMAGSGGDMFPWLFRFHDLGALIGTRTWGGLVGISGVPGLIDGGYTSVPTFGFYETDGTWGVEGYGVAPDIEVIDDPTELANGRDPQLEAAIEHLEAEIQRNPYIAPGKPVPPIRAGMGVTEEDR